MDTDFIPSIAPDELCRLDHICDLGEQFGLDSDVRLNSAMPSIDKWAWELGRRVTEHMQAFEGAAK